MRTIRLIVEYDGTAFSGWQIQTHRPNHTTVQGMLQDALAKLQQQPTKVRAASRTDTGVHARGQVVAFDTDRDNIPLVGFARGLNRYLRDDVVIRNAEVAPDGWNPKRSSRGKRYRYTYWNNPLPTALGRNRSWWVSRPLDVDAMNEAAQHLVGEHDFEAFRSAGCVARHAIRTMYRLEVTRGAHAQVHLEVVGNAFVRNMVRIIAGNLQEVGTGRMTPAKLLAVLESRDRTRGGVTAPPQGLCLEEVIYDDRLPPRPSAWDNSDD